MVCQSKNIRIAQSINSILHFVLQIVLQTTQRTAKLAMCFASFAQPQRPLRYFEKAEYRFAVQECDATEA